MMTTQEAFETTIYKMKYARWLDKYNRRENWHETVLRYRNYFLDRFDLSQSMEDMFNDACDIVLRKEIVPSMRAMWAAGPALDVDNICAYNCTYILVDSVKSFADLLYILMSSCGAGYSVERQIIASDKLPPVPYRKSIYHVKTVVFEDSRIGWAEGLLEYMSILFEDGEIPNYDLSRIRPKGTRLKTFGGRAGGSDGLRLLLDYLNISFQNAQGRRLTSIECHDICCFIANVVVSGGIRRSACLSLSNLSDQRMRDAKVGEFWTTHPQRAMSNNSVAYTEKPDMPLFMREWLSLMNSGSGERGIFNREYAENTFKELGRKLTDDDGNNYVIGTNPCGEILLRPNEACNLSEVIVRASDTYNDLLKKVRAATVLGCMQSCLTDFHFLDPSWKKNMEEERLLGVSLTGIRDHPILNTVNQVSSIWLTSLREAAHETAKVCSMLLNINTPVAVTCNKPSGTVSALMNTASGIHTRFAPYYIRRIRISATDTLCKFLKDQGVPNNPEVGQFGMGADTWVFEFPIKSPPDAIFDTPALEQLEYWKMLKTCWTDHNPSVTIMVEEHEWLEVGAWVYKNWDIIGGLSFLPKSNNVYHLMPFEAIDESEYNNRVSKMPTIDWDDLIQYETEDNTTGAKNYECNSANCDVF